MSAMGPGHGFRRSAQRISRRGPPMWSACVVTPRRRRGWCTVTTSRGPAPRRRRLPWRRGHDLGGAGRGVRRVAGGRGRRDVPIGRRGRRLLLGEDLGPPGHQRGGHACLPVHTASAVRPAVLRLGGEPRELKRTDRHTRVRDATQPRSACRALAGRRLVVRGPGQPEERPGLHVRRPPEHRRQPARLVDEPTVGSSTPGFPGGEPAAVHRREDRQGSVRQEGGGVPVDWSRVERRSRGPVAHGLRARRRHHRPHAVGLRAVGLLPSCLSSRRSAPSSRTASDPPSGGTSRRPTTR